jgi:WD40 repeat protein
MRRILGLLIAVCALVCGSGAVVRGEEKPVLMLDPGGHQAKIRGVTFTPDGNYLVSAGYDKVVRVWDWRAGKTVRTIRGQVGPGDKGKIYAMALSPDGRWLAVGGWFSGTREETIRLYDFASGELKSLLKGHTDVVLSLAFSPDGKRLISGSFDNTAILWDVESRALLHRLEGHRAEIYAVGFTPDGERAVTGSYDHTLRLWRVSDGSLIMEMQGHQNQVTSLAVSPKDGWIASGDKSGEIRLWDGRTGEFVKTLARQGGYVGSLAFSPDRGLLLSTCGYIGCSDTQHVWNVETGKEIVTYTNNDNTVLASAFSPDGRSVVTGGGNQFPIHIWNPLTGETKAVLKGTGRPAWAVGFSADGKSIAWGNTFRYASYNDRGPLEFSMRLPTAGEALGEPQLISGQEGWVRASPTFGPWSLQHRKGGTYGFEAILDVLKDGKVQASIERGSAEGYGHRAYGFTADGKTVISGGYNGTLTAYRLDGTKIGDFVGHEYDLWAVAPSPDSKYLLSGAFDQTVRLWNLQTRELLVTLFRGDDGEWVMWTPEGFFTGSKKGAELVRWQINQGPDKEARYVTADQLRKSFFRPDLVVEKIAGDPTGKVKAEAARLKIDEILKQGSAPEVAILSPADGTKLDEASAIVTVRVTDKGGGIGRITWRVNGQVVGSAFGAPALNDKGEITRSLELATPETRIEVLADTKSDEIQSRPAAVTVTVDEKVILKAPDLYVLAIGANSYRDVRLKLGYAVSDARALGETLAEAGKTYYLHKPEVILLPDEEVTAERVSRSFEELGSKVKANDVFLFYVAGHGKTIHGDFYFVPPALEAYTDDIILKQGFGPKQWDDWFAHIKALKSIWIFDTCESGSAVNLAAFKSRSLGDDAAAYQRMNEATGRTIFMAASDQDVAVEGYHHHGLLTYAILEGLANAGDRGKDKVFMFDLAEYVSTRVPELSRELKACPVTGPKDFCQKPIVPVSGTNYPLVPRFMEILPRLSETPAQSEILPTVPTHVVIQAADVFPQAARGTGSVGSLDQGVEVSVVKTEGGWAQVAQNGKLLGFVEMNRLLKLKR